MRACVTGVFQLGSFFFKKRGGGWEFVPLSMYTVRICTIGVVYFLRTIGMMSEKLVKIK